jgi:SET domain-containing protein
MPSRVDDLEVRRTSAGLGLFTLKPIKAGRRIIEYTGVLITNEEAERKGGKYLFGIDEKYTLDGSPRSNKARYVNHSCRPNAEAYIVGRRVWIYSARDIEEGEEITFDYGADYFDDHIRPKGCRCAACARARAPSG